MLPSPEDARATKMTTPSESSNLSDQVVDLIENWWQEHQSPLLLSLLGSRLGRENSHRIKLESSSLIDYLTRNLSSRVRVIHHSNNPSVAAVVPREIEEDEDSLFEKIPKRTHDHIGGTGPRFRPSFWAAFRVPLDETMARYISTQEPIRFLDISSSDPKPGNHIEIGRQFIASSDSESIEIQQKIGEWLKENDLDPKPFLIDAKEKSIPLPSKDVLGRLLLSLDSDDLKRVHIPMDIVKKLRQRSL